MKNVLVFELFALLVSVLVSSSGFSVVVVYDGDNRDYRTTDLVNNRYGDRQSLPGYHRKCVAEEAINQISNIKGVTDLYDVSKLEVDGVGLIQTGKYMVELVNLKNPSESLGVEILISNSPFSTYEHACWMRNPRLVLQSNSVLRVLKNKQPDQVLYEIAGRFVGEHHAVPTKYENFKK